jgi:hypothetical protein
MLDKIYKINNYWVTYKFEIVVIICIVLILLIALLRLLSGKKGTWSKSYYYPGTISTPKYSPQPRKKSQGEEECRRVLQTIYGRPFNSHRPNFLRNSVTGGSHNLELDCYDSDLSLAVEYNGAQHYKYTPHFHKNKEAFYNQKYRDDMKRRICKDMGVTLIEVPYTIKIENINLYLKEQLQKNGKL